MENSNIPISRKLFISEVQKLNFRIIDDWKSIQILPCVPFKVISFTFSSTHFNICKIGLIHLSFFNVCPQPIIFVRGPNKNYLMQHSVKERHLGYLQIGLLSSFLMILNQSQCWIEAHFATYWKVLDSKVCISWSTF